MLPQGFWSRCCGISVVRLTSRQVRPRAGNIEQYGARGQAISTRTCVYGIARVANFFPSTVLENAVEHLVGAAGTQPALRGQAVHWRACAANFLPSTAITNAVEHWVGAAGTRECTDVTRRYAAFATGHWSTRKACHAAAGNMAAVVGNKVSCACVS